MGQKINPIGLRLGINRTWDSRWFAGKNEYGKLLHEDVKIREILHKELKQAAVAKIVIERPHNRGVAMNPIDHPHGGGEGRTSGGRHPVTPWGKPTKGKKTRTNKSTSKFILLSRHKRKK